METLRTDVCVVGAGPGGAAASVFLARRGVRHVLLDKAAFPRDKVCGDALTINAVYMLNKLEPGWVRRELLDRPDFRQSWGLRVYTTRNRRFDFDFKGEPMKHAPFVTCPREKLDALLLNKLDPQYADVRYEAEAQAVKREAEGFTVEFSEKGEAKRLQARLVIGADGERSVVRRTLGRSHDKGEDYSASVRQYFEGVDFSDNPNDLLEAYFIDAINPGYFWVFPMPEGRANVGIIMFTHDIRQRKAKLRELFNQIIETHPVIAPKFKGAKAVGKPLGWGLPLWNARRPISGDGFLLCGDAASLIDYFTGEGIGNAMISGMTAAKHAAQALESERFDAQTLSAYDRELYKRFDAEMRFSKFVWRMASRPALFNATMRLMAGTPLFWPVKRQLRLFLDRWL